MTGLPGKTQIDGTGVSPAEPTPGSTGRMPVPHCGTGARCRPRKAGWASPRYWTCLLILVASAVGVPTLAGWFGVYLQKEAVPLKRPLQLFDVRRVGPRYERHPVNDQMPAMSEDMVDTLGTREYLQISLTDTRKQASDPTRVAQLFVTYYTGRPDMVPHVPDECYLAGGYDSLGAATEAIRVPGIGAPRDEVPVRMVRFRAPPGRRRSGAGSGETAVTYFFSVNGGYAASRDGVRVKLSNPFQRYAYYAKIEVTFTDDKIALTAEPDAAIAALGPLLEAVMPVLIEDHFDLGKFAPAKPADGPARQ